MDGIQNVINQHKHSDLKPVAPEDLPAVSTATPANQPVDEFELDLGDPIDLPTLEDTPETKTEPKQSEEPSEESTETIDASEIKKTLHNLQDQINGLLKKLEGVSAISKPKVKNAVLSPVDSSGNIVEGVFNGEKMVDADGKEYSVPPNYASKSKLVEGDIMKLTIRDDGSFLYKQISPVVRKRIVGNLAFDEETQRWTAMVDTKPYKILTASVTFYKGNEGDEVVILVPDEGDSSWGAVENIIST